MTRAVGPLIRPGPLLTGSGHTGKAEADTLAMKHLSIPKCPDSTLSAAYVIQTD